MNNRAHNDNMDVSAINNAFSDALPGSSKASHGEMEVSAMNNAFSSALPGASKASKNAMDLFAGGDHTSALEKLGTAGEDASAVKDYVQRDPSLRRVFSILSMQDGKTASNFGICKLFLDAFTACIRVMKPDDSVIAVRSLVANYKKLILHPLSASDGAIVLAGMHFLHCVAHTQPVSVLREMFSTLELTNQRSFTNVPARVFGSHTNHGSQKRRREGSSVVPKGMNRTAESHERRRAQFAQCRRLYVEMLLACLARGDAEFTAMLFYAPLPLWHGILGSLAKDTAGDVQRVLHGLYTHVLLEPSVKIITKKQLFARKTLQSIVALYDSDDAAIVQAAHGFFLDAIAQYEHVFQDDDHKQLRDSSSSSSSSSSSFSSNVLLSLVLQLKANEDATQQNLVLSVLQRYPELLTQYIRHFPYSCDPRLSYRWMGNITVLQKLLRILASSSSSVRASDADDSNKRLARLVSRMLPKKLSVADIKSGLMHKSALIRYLTLGLLQSLFMCYEATVERLRPITVDALSILSAELRKLLPDVKVVYVLWTTMKPDVQDKQSQLTLARTLNVLNLFQRNIPQCFAEAKFDMHKRIGLLMDSKAHNAHTRAAYVELLRGHRGLSPLLWEDAKLKSSGAAANLLPRTGVGILLYCLMTAPRDSVLFTRTYAYLEQILTRVQGLWLDVEGSELRNHYHTMQIEVWLSRLSVATLQPFEAVLGALVKKHQRDVLRTASGEQEATGERLPLLESALEMLAQDVDSHWHTYLHLVMHGLLMLFAALPSPLPLRAFATHVCTFEASAAAADSHVGFRQFRTSEAFVAARHVCQRVLTRSTSASFAHFEESKEERKNAGKDVVDDVIERLSVLFKLHEEKIREAREEDDVEGDGGEGEARYMDLFGGLVSQLWTHIARLLPEQLSRLLPPMLMFCRNLTPTHWRQLVCDGVLCVVHEFSLFELDIVRTSRMGGDMRELLGRGLSVPELLFHLSQRQGDAVWLTRGGHAAQELLDSVMRERVFSQGAESVFPRFMGLHLLCSELCSVLRQTRLGDLTPAVCMLDCLVHGVCGATLDWMPFHLVQAALLQPNGGIMAVLPRLASSSALFSYVVLLMSRMRVLLLETDSGSTRALASIALDAYVQLVTETCVATRDDCLPSGQLPFAFEYVPLCADLLTMDQCTALIRRLLPSRVPAESREVVQWWMQCLLQSPALLETILSRSGTETMRVLPMLIEQGVHLGIDTQHAERLLCTLAEDTADVRAAPGNNLLSPAFFSFCVESLVDASSATASSAHAAADRSLLLRSLLVAAVLRKNNPLHVALFGRIVAASGWTYRGDTQAALLFPALAAYASCVDLFDGPYSSGSHAMAVREKVVAALQHETLLSQLLSDDEDGLLVGASVTLRGTGADRERAEMPLSVRALLMMHACSLSTQPEHKGESVEGYVQQLMSRVEATRKKKKKGVTVNGMVNSIMMNLFVLGGKTLRKKLAPAYILACIDSFVHAPEDEEKGEALQDALLESVETLCVAMADAPSVPDAHAATKLLKKLVKVLLKRHIASDAHMRVLSVVLESFASIVEQGTLFMATVCDMLLSHSKFVSLVLSDVVTTQATAQMDGAEVPTGIGAVKLLQSLLRLRGVRLKALENKKTVYLLLAAYRGTTHTKDSLLFDVLQAVEYDALAFPPFVGSHTYKFGDAGKTKLEQLRLDEAADGKAPVSVTSSVDWVYSAFDSAILRRGPQVETAQPADTRVACYNAAFLFPFLDSLFAQSRVDIKRLIRMGMTAFLLKGMSHPAQDVRERAYDCVSAFFGALEAYKEASSGFAEYAQVHLVLTALKNGISEEHQRLPALVVEFVSFSLTIMLQPSHALYKPINKFFIARPAIDVRDVPMFYELFHSRNASDYKQHRSWFLRFVGGDGAHLSELDLEVLKRRFTIQVLLSFYDSDVSDFHTRRQILSILGKCVAADVRAVLKEYNLLAWLRVKLLQDMPVLHLSGWTQLLRLLHNVLLQLEVQVASNDDRHDERAVEDELVLLLFELCASFDVIHEVLATRRVNPEVHSSSEHSSGDMVMLYVSVMHRAVERVRHRLRVPHCQAVVLLNDTRSETMDASAYLTPEWFVNVLMALYDGDDGGEQLLARASPLLVSIAGSVWPRVPVPRTLEERHSGAEHVKALLIWLLTALTEGSRVEANYAHMSYLFRLLTALHAGTSARITSQEPSELALLAADQSFNKHFLRLVLNLSWFSHAADRLYSFFLNSAIFTYVVSTTDHGHEVRHATGSVLLDKMHRLVLSLLPNPLLDYNTLQQTFRRAPVQLTAFVQDTRTLLYQHHLVAVTEGEKAGQRALRQLLAFAEIHGESQDATIAQVAKQVIHLVEEELSQ